MRIALVGAEIEENLGLRYLSSALRRAGHETVIVPFDHGGEIPFVARMVANGGFDLTGLGMMFQLRGREFCALAGRIRAEGYRGMLVGGGQWATFMAREILEDNAALDAIVLGEGEVPIVEIAEACAAADRREALSRVTGLVLRTDDGAVVKTPPREGRVALESLAAPLRDVPRKHLGMPSAPLVSSRGCYADCTFCSIVAWEKLSGGSKFRQRAPAHVADEMAALYHERGIRVFNFHDDNFWLPTPKASKARMLELRRELDKRRVRDIALLLKCRPNDVDRELFVACKEMGLVRAYIGIESDAPAGLVTLRRGVSQAQNQRALDVLSDLDIHVCSNLLLFDPDTRLEDVPHNIGFYERNAHHTLNFCRTEAYGGTPLTARLALEGRLTGDYLGFDYSMRDPRVELLWRICHVAFHERNFPAEGLSNSIIGLGYRFHLAKRFWPSAELERLRDVVYDFIVRFGRSQARHLSTALEYARTCDPTDRDVGTLFTIDLSRAIREEDAGLTLECETLVRAVEAYAERRGAGGSDGRLGEGAAGSGWLHGARLAAGVALATAACSSSATTPRDGSVVIVGQPDAGTSTNVPPQGPADSDGRAGTVVAHVGLGPGRTMGFGPGTEGGRFLTLVGDATVQGAGAEQYELEGVEVDPPIADLEDRFITSTGSGVHFELAARPQGVGDGLGVVRARFRHRGGGAPLVATAVFRTYEGGRVSIGTAVVPATPPYMVCDPAPAPRLTAINVDRFVHIGRDDMWSAGAGPIQRRYDQVPFKAWLDAAVQGEIQGAPTATVGGGTVTGGTPAQTFGPEPPPPGRLFAFTYDPRNADGRLAAGTHTLTITFQVVSRGVPHPFSASVPVTVTDDGLVTIGAPAPPQQVPLKMPGLPLERRFAARIVGEPDVDDALVLTVEAATDDPAPAFLWRASGGELVFDSASRRAVWTPPAAPGRHVVTCAVQTETGDLAIATYSRDV